jgi:hypothetical protein
MRIEQRIYSPALGWRNRVEGLKGHPAQLVFLFGGRHLLEDPRHMNEVGARYPGAQVVAASTAGEITGTEVTEDQLTTIAIAFDRTRLACATTDVSHADASYTAGSTLAARLVGPDLVHVFVLSDGARVNGTELARGFNETLPTGVALTGGLAGDGTRFEKTLVGLDCPPVAGRIVAVAFYGRHLHTAFGSSGGWSPFGPERLVTRAAGNVLQALDGKSALQLYKNYLGDHAAQLPGSALRFPLTLTAADGRNAVVRTILSIDEKEESMTFAGDIPVGARVRFMRASYEDLVDGAAHAAGQIPAGVPSQLVICISCVGRRIVLGQRIEEETEIMREAFGPDAVLTGFYSYGELAPAHNMTACQLHNQTMTITAFWED